MPTTSAATRFLILMSRRIALKPFLPWILCVATATATATAPIAASADELPDWARTVAESDDSDTARQAAVARLRSAPARAPCGDPSTGSRDHGTTCASREFPAPPLLDAPAFRWKVDLGWWAVWSPFLIDGKVLTGSCNNDDNRGLSALDMNSGKVAWRIDRICGEGNRAGSMGRARFYELDPRTVLFTLGRDDGKPEDYHVVDVRAGRILRTLSPVRRGPWAWQDGVFAVITRSTPDRITYLNGLNAAMDQVIWRHDTFRFMCDRLDPHCEPVFSPGAGSDGIVYFSATARDQPEPPTRQLHAFEAGSGRLLWRHTEQPEFSLIHKPGHRSDDGAPIVADGKVIVRLGRYLDAQRNDRAMSLRALDARTGAIAWTTEPMPLGFGFRKGLRLGNRVAAAGVLVVEYRGDEGRQLLGYRLSDGRPLWRRAVGRSAVLTASAGGVFLVADKTRSGSDETLLLEGFDAESGTRLWTARLPGHNLPFTGEWDTDAAPSTLLQGPSWRIGRDGAIYGVSMTGAYRLQ
jgi:outer membrane protein assembly factor BamB